MPPAPSPSAPSVSAPSPSAPSGEAAVLFEALRAVCLGLPEAWEDHPWGETVFKVRKKVFVFVHLGTDADNGAPTLSVTTKLPQALSDVLARPDATPASHGLGRHGWVTVRPVAGALPPIETVEDWVRESYRAVAPKTLARRLDGRS